MKKRLLLLILACLSLVSAWAQTASISDIEKLLVNKDITALRQKLKEETPASLLVPAVLHYSVLTGLAGALGDVEAQLDIHRRWLKVDPSNTRPLIGEARNLSELGRYEEAIAKEQVLFKQAFEQHVQVRVGSYMAGDLAKIGRFNEAQKILDDLKTKEAVGQWYQFRNTNAHNYWPHLASAEYHLARCELASRTFRWADAEAACSKEVEFRQLARESSGLLPDARLRQGANSASVGELIRARMRMALTLARAQKYYSAEQLMRKLKEEVGGRDLAIDVAAGMPAEYAALAQIGRVHLVPVYLTHAQIRFMQHRYQEALQFAEQGLLEVLPWTAGHMGEQVHAALETKLLIGVALGDWSGVARDLQIADRLTHDADAKPRAAAGFTLVRALLAAQQQDWSGAEMRFAEHHQQLRSTLGERHFKTALVAGLRARAGLRSGVDLARHGDTLRAAVQVLMDPQTAGQSLSDVGENRVLLRQVLQALLDDARATTPGDAALAFQAADHLRANVTQRSIQAAAVRRSFNDPELAALVRQLQDQDSLLLTFYERMGSLLAKGMSLDAPEMAALRSSVERSEVLRMEARQKIGARYAAYARLAEPQPASVKSISQQLGPSELFVAVSPSESGSMSWGIRPDGQVSMYRAPLPQARIQAMVSRLRATLDVAGQGDQAPAFDSVTSRQLYQQLLAPLLDTASDKEKPTHLIIAVSGAMTQLPMGVLNTAAEGQAPRWLIEDQAISHVTSASSWLALKEAAVSGTAAAEPLMAWGDPEFARGKPGSAATRRVRASLGTATPADATSVRALRYDQIPALPETRDELLAIARSLKAQPSDLLLGSAATRASVLALSQSGALARKRVIAFATHGLLAGELPDLTQPALALALQSADNTEFMPNLLTLDDILGLKLQADWVVLSACNTAGSDGTNQDGISGLARGFFYAGARTVLATHWAVESTSAMQITTETFRQYQQHATLPKAEALRQAMLQVMRQPGTAHPAFWAPYALVGDGSR